MTSVRVPATQPHTASTTAAASTRPGRVIETASERLPTERIRAPCERHGAARASSGERGEELARLRRPAPRRERQGREPGRRRDRQGDRPVPSTSSSPNERTIGIGESTSAANPAAVARQAAPITGPPLEAATVAARAGCGPVGRWPR